MSDSLPSTFSLLARHSRQLLYFFPLTSLPKLVSRQVMSEEFVEEAAASKASVSPLSKHREAQEEPGVNSRARERTLNVDKTRKRAEDNRAMVAESYVEGEVRRVRLAPGV